MAFDAWGHSWGGPLTRFVVWGANTQVSPPPTPYYGRPFADFNLALSPNLDFLHLMRADVSLRIPSLRIDINGESEP